MAKWWIGVVVMAMTLTLATEGLAQVPPGPQGPPMGYAPPAATDPVPFAPAGAYAAPAGGAPLPTSCQPGYLGAPPPSSGDDEEEATPYYPCKCGWYVNLGSRALKRQRLGHLLIAVQDPNAAGTDTGIATFAGTSPEQDLREIDPGFSPGYQATWGYYWENGAFELTGFYLPEYKSINQITDPGRLNLPFFNAPLGFQGDNGMWLQADLERTTLRTTMGNVEANLHWFADHCPYWELIAGVRYVDMQERLSIFTDDDGLTTVGANGNPDPTLQATYFVKTHNRIFAPQVGVQYNQPLGSVVTIGGYVKGAWGPNMLAVDVLLQRGDGLVGIDDHRRGTKFSQLYEGGLFLDVCPHEAMHVRFSWDTLTMLHVATAEDQVSYDLSKTLGQQKNDGNVIYHGPRLEFVFLF